MRTHSIAKTFAFGALAVTLVAGLAVAQQPAAPAAKAYEPQRGQAGKDVIWIPTPETLVERMLDISKVTPNDTVIDLGSGDGRTVIAAAKRGAKAVGIEYNPDMVEFSKKAAATAGVKNATFIHGDIFKEDFTYATVLTLFLLDDLNARLRPIILDKMKPGTRVVSNTFTMQDWTPDEIIRPGPNCGAYCQAFFWVVPAKVGGTWQTPDGTLILNQSFQMLTGTFRTAYGEMALTGKMHGNDILLVGNGITYTGKVDGNSMTLTGKPTQGADVSIKATKS